MVTPVTGERSQKALKLVADGCPSWLKCISGSLLNLLPFLMGSGCSLPLGSASASFLSQAHSLPGGQVQNTIATAIVKTEQTAPN